MKNLRNRIDVKLLSNEKDIKWTSMDIKWTSNPSSMSQKIFYNNLVVIRKSKVTLMVNKSAYIGMCDSLMYV